jgi:predicted PurR-regulated permease PerM
MAKLKPILKNPIRKRAAKPVVPEDFGSRGEPLNRSHPFYFGFFVAAGGITSFTFLRAIASASQAIVLILISLFFAAGLNPAVVALQRRKLSRPAAVGAIVSAVIIFLGIFIWVAIPPIVDQVNLLLHNAPKIVGDLKNNSTISKLNSHYGFIDVIQKKVTSSIKDGHLAVSVFGGVIGVGKAVISGAVAALTILILTLYFLVSLPSVTKVAYRMVPASRRDRVSKLSDAVIYRIGIFVGGQASVAVLAGIFTLILGFSLNLPYKTALAMLVFICGLIPLVGHFLGITVVTLVAVSKSPTAALIAFIAYLIYVQIENYLIMPRIMKRSLSVPGLVTIIAILIGTSLLGLIGGLVSVPLAAAVLLILDEVVFPNLEKA